MNAFTFNLFWDNYHNINRINKVNKSACEKLWDMCNCIGKKKKLIQLREKSKLSCYEYLKIKL